MRLDPEPDPDDPLIRAIRRIVAGPPKKPVDVGHMVKRARKRRILRGAAAAGAALAVAIAIPVGVGRLRGPTMPVIEQPTWPETASSVPSTPDETPSLRPVPSVIGHTVAQATDSLELREFVVVIEPEDHQDPETIVIDTEPPPGELVPPGSTIIIIVEDQARADD